MIKFLDLNKQDKNIQNRIIKDFKNIINKSNFINGNEIKEFENKFANYIGSKYAISVANGTDALIIALKALNLKKNDEVILPAMTWKSTLLSVTNLNLKPILVDINKKNSNMNLIELKQKISKRTKVIIAVHLYGNPCELKKIKKLIKNKKIFIIEDAAQAHGAYDYDLKKNAGSIGTFGCFSFYPGKNIGAYGDAGCVTTNSKYLANRVRKIKNIGSLNKFDCEIQGINSRLDTLQAAVLKNKIIYLDKNNKKRKLIAKFYTEKIKNEKIIKLDYEKGCVYHQYVILSKIKKKIINSLTKNKIQFGEHYPISINNLKFIKKDFVKEKFKNAEFLAKYCISLPIDPTLKMKELKRICNVLNNS